MLVVRSPGVGHCVIVNLVPLSEERLGLCVGISNVHIMRCIWMMVSISGEDTYSYRSVVGHTRGAIYE